MFRSNCRVLFPLSLVALLSGCQPADPVAHFIAKTDAAPPEKRPPNWENTKRLMARSAPAVGTQAPDFTLPTLEGSGQITRTAYQGSQPLVLIFGSFT